MGKPKTDWSIQPEKQKDPDTRPFVMHGHVKFRPCPKCGSLDLIFRDTAGKTKPPAVTCNECGLHVTRDRRTNVGDSNQHDTWPALADLWNKTKEERLEHVIKLLSENFGNSYVGHITLDIWGDQLKGYLEEKCGKTIYFKPPEYDYRDPGLYLETYHRTGHEYDTIEEANAHRLKKNPIVYSSDIHFNGGF